MGRGVVNDSGCMGVYVWASMNHIPPCTLHLLYHIATWHAMCITNYNISVQYLLICSIACFLVIFTARDQKEGFCHSLSFLGREGHNAQTIKAF